MFLRIVVYKRLKKSVTIIINVLFKSILELWNIHIFIEEYSLKVVQNVHNILMNHLFFLTTRQYPIEMLIANIFNGCTFVILINLKSFSDFLISILSNTKEKSIGYVSLIIIRLQKYIQYHKNNYEILCKMNFLLWFILYKVKTSFRVFSLLAN